MCCLNPMRKRTMPNLSQKIFKTAVKATWKDFWLLKASVEEAATNSCKLPQARNPIPHLGFGPILDYQEMILGWIKDSVELTWHKANRSARSRLTQTLPFLHYLQLALRVNGSYCPGSGRMMPPGLPRKGLWIILWLLILLDWHRRITCRSWFSDFLFGSVFCHHR